MTLATFEMNCFTDCYAVLLVQIALFGVWVVALVKSAQARFDSSGLKKDVFRGPESRRRFGVAYGFGSVIILQLINASEAFKGNKVLISIADIAMLFYLCFLSGWFRNKIIGWTSKWESKPETH